MRKFAAVIVGVIIICLLGSCAPYSIKDQSGLPKYTILKTLDLDKEQAKYGDVLVKGLTKEMEKSYFNELFLKISSKENFTEMSIYCTEEAFRANWSKEYSEKNPNARKDGYIGMIKDGKIFLAEGVGK